MEHQETFVIKMQIDTDTQWAYWDRIHNFYKEKEGEYVENFDPEAFKISIWSGDVEIRNLRLKSSAFKVFQNLPIELAYGSIGLFRLKVSWKNISSKPLQIQIDDVYVMLQVNDDIKRNRASDHTLFSIEERVKLKRAQVQAQMLESDNSASKATHTGFVSRVVTKLLDNLQIQINNVHIRVQDPGFTDPEYPMAFGLVLEQLIIQSADRYWNFSLQVRGATSDSLGSCLRKRIELKRCGFYWDLKEKYTPLKLENTSVKEFASQMAISHPHTFLVLPANHFMRLTVNDKGISVPLSSKQFRDRVMRRLGTTWIISAIDAIGDDKWRTFVESMPVMAGKEYTVSFVFTEAWSEACDRIDDEGDFDENQGEGSDLVKIPTVEQYKHALSIMLQWSKDEIEEVDSVVSTFHTAAVFVLQEKSTLLDVEFHSELISLVLHQKQYHSLLGLLSYLTAHQTKLIFAEFRPGKRILEAPREWWKYAIEAVLMQLREQHKRIDWEAVLMKKSQRVTYVRLYTKEALQSSQLNQDEKDELNILEDEFSIEEIVKYRKLAQENYRKRMEEQQLSRKKSADQQEKAPASTSFFSYSYWFTPTESTSRNSQDPLDAFSLSEKEKKQIYQAIDYSPSSSAASEPVQPPVQLRIHSALDASSLKLMNSSMIELLALGVNGMELEVSARKTSFEVGLVIEDMVLEDRFTTTSITVPPNTPLGCIVERMSLEEASSIHPDSQEIPALRLRNCEASLPLLCLQVQLPPPDANADIRVILIAQPLNVILYTPFLLQCASFFKRPTNVNLDAIDQIAWANAAALTNYSAAQLYDAMTQRTRLLLEMDITSPTLSVVQNYRDGILPYQKGVRMKIHLGHLHTQSTIQPNISAEDLMNDDEVYSHGSSIEHLYDTIRFTVHGFEALIIDDGQARSDWVKVIKRSSAVLVLSMSVVPQFSRIPLIRLNGELEQVRVNLSTLAYRSVLCLMGSISSHLQDHKSEPVALNARNIKYDGHDGESIDGVDLLEGYSTPYRNSFTNMRKFVNQYPSPPPRHKPQKSKRNLSQEEILRLWKLVSMHACFSAKGIELQLRDNDDKDPIIVAELQNITIEFTQRTYDQIVQFNIGEFNVRDYLLQRENSSPTEYYLVSSKTNHGGQLDKSNLNAGGSCLLRITCAIVSSDSIPDSFQTPESILLDSAAVDQCKLSVQSLYKEKSIIPISLDIKFESLAFNFHRVTIASILKFALSQDQSRDNEEEGRSLKYRRSRSYSLATDDSSETSSISSFRRFERKRRPRESRARTSNAPALGKIDRKISLQVRVHVKCLAVNLVQENTLPLANVIADNFSLAYAMSGEGKQLASTLALFQVNDIAPDGLSSQIIGVKTQDLESITSTNDNKHTPMLRVDFSSLGTYLGDEWTPGFATSVGFALESPEIRLLFRFIQDIQLFLSTGPIFETLAELYPAENTTNQDTKPELPVVKETSGNKLKSLASLSRLSSYFEDDFQDSEVEETPEVSNTENVDQYRLPKLNLSLTRSVIEMPKHSNSSESLVLRFGSLEVHNLGDPTALASISSDDSANTQKLSAELKDLRIITRKPMRSKETGDVEVEAFSLLGGTEVLTTLTFGRSMSIHVEGTPIRFACSQEQYDMCLAIPLSNMSEPLNIPAVASPKHSDRSEQQLKGPVEESTHSNFEMRITVSIPEISMQLLAGREGYLPTSTGDLAIAKQAAPNSIAGLQIDLFTVELKKCQSSTGNLTEIKSSINVIKAYDARPSGKVSDTYKAFFLIEDHDAEGPSDSPRRNAIEVNFQSDVPASHLNTITSVASSPSSEQPTQDMGLRLAVLGMKLIPSNILLDLLDFIVGERQESPFAVKQGDQPDEIVSAPAAEPKSAFAMDVEIDFESVSLLLVEDNTLMESRSLLLAWETALRMQLDQQGFQLQLSLNDIHATSRLRRGQLFAIDTSTSIKASDCIKPFRIGINILSEYEQLSSVMYMEINSVVQVRLGYLDCSTISSALTSMLQKENSNPMDEKMAVAGNSDKSALEGGQAGAEKLDEQEAKRRYIEYGKTKVKFVSLDGTFDAIMGYHDNGRTASGHRQYLTLPPMATASSQQRFTEMTFCFHRVPLPPSEMEKRSSKQTDSSIVRYGEHLYISDTLGNVVGKHKSSMASGHLGPDGNMGVFCFRIWKASSTSSSLDKTPVQFGDRIVLEGLTRFKYGESVGGFLMYDGHGDGPVPFVLRSGEDLDGSMNEESNDVPKTILPSTHYRITTAGFEVTLINDANNMHLPLFHFSVPTVNVELRSLDTRSTAIVRIELEASFYNLFLSVWEPLLEHWIVQLILHQKGGICCQDCKYKSPLSKTNVCPNVLRPCIYDRKALIPFIPISVSARDTQRHIRRELLDNRSDIIDEMDATSTTLLITAPEMLNINVTPELFDVLLEFLSVFSQSEAINRSHSLGSFVCIENRSGVAFEYALASTESKFSSMPNPLVSPKKHRTASDDEWIRVEPNQVHRTTMYAHEAPAGRLTGPLHRSIWLRADDPLLQGSNAFLIALNSVVDVGDKNGILLLPQTNYELLCLTAGEQGTLVLRLQTFYQVKSFLPLPISLIYSFEDENKIQIDTGGLHRVPIQALNEETQIAFTPFAADQDVKEELLWMNLFSLVGKSGEGFDERIVTTFACERGSADRTEYFHVILARTRLSHDVIQLELHPPIQLMNLLPHAIDCRFVVIEQSETIAAACIRHQQKHGGEDHALPSGYALGKLDFETPNMNKVSIALQLSIPSINCSLSSVTQSSIIYGPKQFDDLEPVIHIIDPNGNPILLKVELSSAFKCQRPRHQSTDDQDAPRSGRHTSEQGHLASPIFCKVYAEYWMIDRTPYRLMYSQCSATSASTRIMAFPPTWNSCDATEKVLERTRSSDLKHQIPLSMMSFMLASVAKNRGRKISVTLTKDKGHEAWSDEFDIAAIGVYGQLSIPPEPAEKVENYAPIEQYDFGVAIDRAPGRFSRTTVVTFLPRYRLLNRLDTAIEIRQQRSHISSPEEYQTWHIAPGEEIAYHWQWQNQPKKIQIRLINISTVLLSPRTRHNEANVDIEGTFNTEWSGGFELRSVGDFILHLPKDPPEYGIDVTSDINCAPHRELEDSLLRTRSLHVEIQLHDPVMLICFQPRELPKVSTYVIRNESSCFSLSIYQTGYYVPVLTKVAPMSTMDFELDEPMGEKTIAMQILSSPIFHYRPHHQEQVPDRPVGFIWLPLDKPRVERTVELEDKHKLLRKEAGRRLWIKLQIEGAAKVIHVTDVLPGQTQEHQRRARSILLQQWKLFKLNVAMLTKAQRQKLKQHHQESPTRAQSPVKPNAMVYYCLSIVQASYLHELLSNNISMDEHEQNDTIVQPFVVLKINEKEHRVEAQKHSSRVAWYPHHTCGYEVGWEARGMHQIELQVRLADRLFGSSLVGHLELDLKELWYKRLHGTEHCFDGWVSLLRKNKQRSSVCELAKVRLHIAKSTVSAEDALLRHELHKIHHALHSSSALRSQFQRRLEDKSTDVAIEPEQMDIIQREESIEDIDEEIEDEANSEPAYAKTESSVAGSEEESKPQLQNLVVMVIDLSELNIPEWCLEKIQPSVDGENRVKVYCSLSYGDFTRSTDAVFITKDTPSTRTNVNRPTNLSESSDSEDEGLDDQYRIERRDSFRRSMTAESPVKLPSINPMLPGPTLPNTRTYRVLKNYPLGLSLFVCNGHLIVRSLNNSGQCISLPVYVGDFIVALNGKRIPPNVTIEMVQSVFQEAISSASTSEEAQGTDKEGTYDITFETPDNTQSTDFSYRAEWNRCVTFDELAVPTRRRKCSSSDECHKATILDSVDDRVRVRIYVQRSSTDTSYSTDEEASALIPLLYFFGEDATLDDMNPSHYCNRDVQIGECWIPLPTSSTSLDQKSAVFGSSQPSATSTASIPSPTSFILGELRVVMRWENPKPVLRNEVDTFVKFDWKGIGISLINNSPSPHELLYASITSSSAGTDASTENSEHMTSVETEPVYRPGLSFSYCKTTLNKELINLEIDQFQIDNQLLQTNYPVLLFPNRDQDQPLATTSTPAETETRAGGSEQFTLHFMTIYEKPPHQIYRFDYLFTQIAEIEVKLEDFVLAELLELVGRVKWDSLFQQQPDAIAEESAEFQYLHPVRSTRSGTTTSVSMAFRLLDQLLTTQENTMLNTKQYTPQKVIVQWLLIRPLQLTLTFTTTLEQPLSDAILAEDTGAIVRTIVNVATAVVSNLDSASIDIPEFYTENVFETFDTLVYYLTQHYISNGLRSLYKLVGAIDFLGNPIGLVSTLGTGVKDFFYTPAQMLLEHEDGLKIENLRTGMTKGSKSLIKNTTIGIFHTTGKITETLGKGVAMLAMDAEYNAQRHQRALKQNTAIQHLGDGIVEGGKDFVGGVWQGIRGVVADPIKGAEKDGAGGFVLGLGKGFAGLIVKPTAGVLDLFTSLAQGVHNTAAAIDTGRMQCGFRRVRLPRRFCGDSVLVFFSEREAQGQALMVLHGLHDSDLYIYHFTFGEANHECVVILTDRRILCASATKGTKVWELANDATLEVVTNGTVISITQGAHLPDRHITAESKVEVSPTSNLAGKSLTILCPTELVAAHFKVAVDSAKVDVYATRYLVLNLEIALTRQRMLQNNPFCGDGQRKQSSMPSSWRRTISESSGSISVSQDPSTFFTLDDIRGHSFRSVRVRALTETELESLVASHELQEPLTQALSDSAFAFTVYEIIVSAGPFEWTIYRRFRDFCKLQDDLRASGFDLHGLQQLPPRRLVFNRSASVIKYREEALGVYLQSGVLMDTVLSHSSVAYRFLTSGALRIHKGGPRRRSTFHPSKLQGHVF